MNTPTLPAAPLGAFLQKKSRYYSRDEMAAIADVGTKRIHDAMSGAGGGRVSVDVADKLITRLHGVPSDVYGDEWYEAFALQTKS